MSEINRINHVAIVVDDLDDALRFWQEGLGLEVQYAEEGEDQDSIIVFLPTGEAEVELVSPTTEAGGLARYLARKGPGLHHICFEVNNIQAYLEQLIAFDIQLINPKPVVGTGGKRIAFIHPDSTHGVLIELYEITNHESEIRLARARALADRAFTQGLIVASGVSGFLHSLREVESGEDLEDLTLGPERDKRSS